VNALGSLTMELWDGHQTAQTTFAAKVAEHEVVAGKARPEWLGLELIKRKFDFILESISGAGRTVQAAMTLMYNMHASGEAQLLILAGRPVGYYIITSYTVDTEVRDADGAAIWAKMSVELLEHPDEPAPLQPAPARRQPGGKKPPTSPPPAPAREAVTNKDGATLTKIVTRG